MRKVSPVFSHVNYQKKSTAQANWGKPLKHDEALSASPYKVKTYDDLVRTVAQIAHYNRKYSLFFRGQAKDYQKDGKTSILPSIYRRKVNEKNVTLKNKFLLLKEKSEQLISLINKQQPLLAGTALLNRYEELQWAILQHYEICETPLLDITHSLHVACSFAQDNNSGKTGIVYVLGMPYPSDSISFNTYEELLNVKLAGFCPPQAQRPFFQEGYLTGPFPYFNLEQSEKKSQFDFAKRLIAKFEIPVKESFWGAGFSAIPHGKLYQEKDVMKTICEKIR